jgi:hypothetical protein
MKDPSPNLLDDLLASDTVSAGHLPPYFEFVIFLPVNGVQIGFDSFLIDIFC